jgi:hypothetical protein
MCIYIIYDTQENECMDWIGETLDAIGCLIAPSILNKLYLEEVAIVRYTKLIF